MSGTIFYLLTCFQGPMHSLRSVNAIVSKTDWIPGHAHMAVLGTFSFLRDGGRVLRGSANLQDDAALRDAGELELLVVPDWRAGHVYRLWLGGFWQGWQWNNPSIPFIDTVVALSRCGWCASSPGSSSSAESCCSCSIFCQPQLEPEANDGRAGEGIGEGRLYAAQDR